jgi:hypothetical protein
MQEGDAEEKTAREHNKLNYSNETSVKQRGKKSTDVVETTSYRLVTVYSAATRFCVPTT